MVRYVHKTSPKGYSMRFQRLIAALFLLCILLSALGADARTDPLDIYILLDKSLSMAEEKRFSEARAWILTNIVEKVIIPGDRIFLTAFYGQTTPVWDGPVSSPADKRELTRRIAALRPDGRWTDIGNALDVLKRKLEQAASDGRLKYILLVTDDKQEAPPGSPYFSADGRFSHAFLTYTRVEAHGSWKAITLGVGIDAKVSSSLTLFEGILTHLPGMEGDEAGSKGGSFLSSALPWTLLALLILVLLLLALLVVKRLQSRKRQKEEEGGHAVEGSS